LRWFLAALLGSVTGGIFTLVDLIFPAFDDKKQRVLDKMLKTIVVDANSTTKPTPATGTTVEGSPRSLYS
jgi:uncharacterized RDD family membrane protein YckC